jgi:hypothetical protein
MTKRRELVGRLGVTKPNDPKKETRGEKGSKPIERYRRMERYQGE